jgi:DNA polymerase (family 10)
MTNQEIAQKLKDLRDFLIIAGYEESHALRYTHIARTIEKMAEPVEDLSREGRLTEIPQVGKLIAQYMREIITTGKSSKQTEWEKEAPYSVVEMCRVKGLGPKTAKMLYEKFGIASLQELQEVARSGKLEGSIPNSLQSEIERTTLA